MPEKMKCERCGKKITEENSYVFKVFSYTRYTSVDIGPVDLYRDIEWEIEEALKETEDKTAQELEEDVAVYFRYGLCYRCHRAMADMFKSGKWKK